MTDDPSLHLDLVPFALGSPRIEDAARMFAAVFQEEWEPSLGLVLDQAHRPDFRGRVALVDNTVVGMGFGARAEAGHWWYDGIAAHVGADHPALQEAWNLSELAILPAFRRRGIGTRLVDALLGAQPYPRALLSVIAANAPARQMYEQTGWRYVHPGLVFAFRADQAVRDHGP